MNRLFEKCGVLLYRNWNDNYLYEDLAKYAIIMKVILHINHTYKDMKSEDYYQNVYYTQGSLLI